MRNEATEGVRLILWGLFKKLVVADSFGIIINATYHNLAGISWHHPDNYHVLADYPDLL